MNWFQMLVIGLVVFTVAGFGSLIVNDIKVKKKTIFQSIAEHLPFAIVCTVFLLMAFCMGEVV